MSQAEMSLYRGCTPVVSADFDPRDRQTLSTALIEALSEASGMDPLELPPLYETIDLDAVSQLFEAGGDTTNTAACLCFTVDTWNIFVRGDGRISVCDRTVPTDPSPIFDESV